MTATSIERPLRVGIVGLGRKGRYHLECISLRKDLTVVAAHNSERSQDDVVQHFGARLVSDQRAFVADPAIDLVLVTSSPRDRSPLVVDAFAAGKHVAVEAPLSMSLSDADTMLQSAERAERTLTVIQHRRWDDDFRTVLDLVRSGRLGSLSSARFLAWSYGVSNNALQESDAATPHTATRDSDGFISFCSHRIDQLLELMPGRPETVFARMPAVERESAGRGLQGPLTLFVGFNDGATALIEINLGSLTPLQTGWVLAGTDGGYENFRSYEVTKEGEVFGVPVDAGLCPRPANANADRQRRDLAAGEGNRRSRPIDFDGGEPLDGLYGHLLHNVENDAGSLTAAFSARDVVVMIEAVRESVRSGQVVVLDDKSLSPPALGGAGFPLIDSAETGAS